MSAPTFDTIAGSLETRSGDPFAPGAAIAQYEVIRELGRGGMGRVVLARDIRLGRRVAIKVLTKGSPRLAQRFLSEARTTARLAHENIVVIHEVGEHAGVPYMVLEYLVGTPLSGLVQNGGIPWGRAVELVVPVVRALVHAHEHGIVHRDLKPDNVFLTDAGVVKVLDFGIAKAFAAAADTTPAPTSDGSAVQDLRLTGDGAILGTLPYMSPEQCGMDTVDARTDLWAVGLILYELLTGDHPLAPVTPPKLFRSAALLDQPMPRIAERVADLPEALERATDACLRKHKEQRVASARDLLGLLEPLLPGRLGRGLAEGDSPYPGLAAFQEGDAGRFFGRSREVQHVVTRLRDQPLIAITGPSGAGKSSFVRAGLIPAMKSSGDVWESLVLRPGRDPIAALATLLQPFTSSATDVATKAAEHARLCARLRAEPGTLGTLLRGRARQRGSRIALFVDQFEELYTLVGEEADRRAFADSLAGVADDSATPLRVILSMRSDLLDRISETERLAAEVARGLVFLAAPDRSCLREALVAPLELAGYQFESTAIVDAMLATLSATPAALPLLQFVAARLWEARDRQRRVVPLAAYTAMGGIAGALASHADEAITHMPASSQRLARAIFQRLVTPERTRAIVDAADLTALGDVRQVIDQLVAARLLVVQTRGDVEGATLEIVHESLISSWPRLRRWLEESQEQSAFLAQLASAAKQWDAAGRRAGLLWRGEAADDARRFAGQLTAPLAPREQAYLDAVLRLATRATRIRRIATIATIAILSLLVAAGATAVIQINRAREGQEHEAERATKEADNAKNEAQRATKEAERARAAERESAQRLAEVQEKDVEVKQKDLEVAEKKEDLRTANQELTRALDIAKAERSKADDARRAAEIANAQLRKNLAQTEKELAKLQHMNRKF
jgi:serine/threonine protein kinase